MFLKRSNKFKFIRIAGENKTVFCLTIYDIRSLKYEEQDSIPTLLKKRLMSRDFLDVNKA